MKFYLLCLLLCLTGKFAFADRSNPPNIIMFLIDDQNPSSIGAFGGDTYTPNLDQMAKEGMKGFQEFMVKPDREKQIRKRIEKVRKRIFKK